MLKIGRGFEIQECPKAAGMVTVTGPTDAARLSLGFYVRSGGHYFFSLYVSMIAETNWLLSSNLESDMNNEPAVWNVDK